MKQPVIISLSIFIGAYCAPLCAAPNSSIDLDEPKTIVADKIEYNVRDSKIETFGKTTITTQSGQTLKLNNTTVADNGSQIAGQDIELWLGEHFYISAEKITRDDDITTAIDAMFTACNGCDSFGNAWEISATTIKHDLDTRNLYFHNPVLWMYDVPIFWFPYYYMPDPGVKYRSGLLMPDLNSTNNMGTQINLPIYISLSPYHDATITLSYLTKENPLIQAEHRLNTEHAEFRTNGSFTHNMAGENRWHIFNNDVIELGEYARATIALERTSDKTYLQKYGFLTYYSIRPDRETGKWNWFATKQGEIELALLDKSFLSDKQLMRKIELIMSTEGIDSSKPIYFLTNERNQEFISYTPAILGGHRNLKIYGRLDCKSAKRYIEKGQYVNYRVFFADEETAIAAGYRPCARCMPEAYKRWKERKKES